MGRGRTGYIPKVEPGGWVDVSCERMKVVKNHPGLFSLSIRRTDLLLTEMEKSVVAVGMVYFLLGEGMD